MIKWKVEIEGLPPFFMEGKSAAAVRMQIRKLLRSPDMLLNVSRITEVDFKKMLRARLAGKDTESKENDVKQEVDEDAPATAMGGGGIAGGGIDLPDQPGSGEPGVHPKKKRKQVLIDRKHDRRTKEFNKHTVKLAAARERRQQERALRASYGEQTESTRPDSRFIHDILYK